MDKIPKMICPFDFGLTKKDWAEVKQLAMQIYESKQFGNDQMICSIAAFIMWSETKEEQAAVVEHTQPLVIH